jgi:hypothetical protein
MRGMHRPLFITAFVLLLASAPLSAQHGGGHASGGGHGGMAGHGGFGGHAFSGGHSGSSFAARPSARGYASRPSLSSRGYATRPSLSARGVNRTGGVRVRNYGFRNNRYLNRGYGYPWWGGIYDPYWWDSGATFDYDQQYETGLANEMNEQSLDEQRQREQDDQDVYVRLAPPPPREKERTEAVAATVLVFRDQHKQEVQNYAIVGPTLWNFAAEHTEKIPLSDLDLPATTKANDERGVDFRLPGAPEGQ